MIDTSAFLLENPRLPERVSTSSDRCRFRGGHPSITYRKQIVAIETLRHDHALVIRTDHRLDSVTAQTFHDRLDAATASGEQGVGIDMEELTYISNTGLRVMLQAARKMEDRGVRLALATDP